MQMIRGTVSLVSKRLTLPIHCYHVSFDLAEQDAQLTQTIIINTFIAGTIYFYFTYFYQLELIFCIYFKNQSSRFSYYQMR